MNSYACWQTIMSGLVPSARCVIEQMLPIIDLDPNSWTRTLYQIIWNEERSRGSYLDYYAQFADIKIYIVGWLDAKTAENAAGTRQLCVQTGSDRYVKKLIT